MISITPRISTITMNEVGRLAGVSGTTVSHVINRTRKINPETEAAVLKAIEESGYLGDGIARSLRTGTTHTIGLAMSAISNPYFADVVHAVEREVSLRGYSLILTDTHDEPKREHRAISDILSRRVDAVILAPASDPGPILTQLARRNIAAVLVDRVPSSTTDIAVDAVAVNNREPVAQLIDHLASIGHSRIAMVASLPELTTTTERVDGYRIGLERNRLGFDSELLAYGTTAEEPAADAIEHLLTMPAPPTALVMGNNQMTISSMRELRRRDIRVPDDIALVAFDDFEWADLFDPRLTAIAQPVEDLGRRAVEMLFERMADPGLPGRIERLEPELKHRDSCGCHNG